MIVSSESETVIWQAGIWQAGVPGVEIVPQPSTPIVDVKVLLSCISEASGFSLFPLLSLFDIAAFGT
jgi:hypothetical protein